MSIFGGERGSTWGMWGLGLRVGGLGIKVVIEG